MKLVVGLGNIGSEYDNTRHNIGFMVLDNYLGDVIWKNDFKSLSYKVMINGENVIFIKPSTFMNLSGDAVRYFVNYYHIDLNNLLVIQDDMDLPIGKVRIKFNSSSGGHNGIKSINEALGSNSYLRLKIGISKTRFDTVNYVLGKFSCEELDILSDSLLVCNKVIDGFISGHGNDYLMGRFNQYGFFE